MPALNMTNNSADCHYNNGNSVAYPLLKVQSGSLALTEEALQWLQEQLSMKGVAILGPLGSAKSFLLNCLAKHHAFRCAQGVTGVTDGIDMFIVPESVEHAERTVLFDVEGQGLHSDECYAKLWASILPIVSVLIFTFKGRPHIANILETLTSLAATAESLHTDKSTFGKIIMVGRDCMAHGESESRKVNSDIFTITNSQDAAEIRLNDMRRQIADSFSGTEVILLPPAHDSCSIMASPTFAVREVCEEFGEKISTLHSMIQQASPLCVPAAQQCMTGEFAARSLRTAVASINRGDGVYPQGAMASVIAQTISQKTDLCKRNLDLFVGARGQLLVNPDGYDASLRRAMNAEKAKVFSSIQIYRAHPAHVQALRYIDSYIGNLVTTEAQRNLRRVNEALELSIQYFNGVVEETQRRLLVEIAQDYTKVSVAMIQKDFAEAINTCLDDIRTTQLPASGLRETWVIVNRALHSLKASGTGACSRVVHDRNEQELHVRRFREYVARVDYPKWTNVTNETKALNDPHHVIHSNIEVNGITFVDMIRGSAPVIDVEAVVQHLRDTMNKDSVRDSPKVARTEEWDKVALGLGSPWELATDSLALGSKFLDFEVAEYSKHTVNTLLAWCWNACKDLECAEEVAIRLVQEASEARAEHPTAATGNCGQGFAGRFKNALRGFIDVDYQVLEKESSELFTMAWTHHVIHPKDLTSVERRAEAARVCDEHKVSEKRRTEFLKYLEEHLRDEAI